MPAGSSFGLIGALGRTTLSVGLGSALQGVSPLACSRSWRHRRPLVWQASQRGGRLCPSPRQQHWPPLISHLHWESPGCLCRHPLSPCLAPSPLRGRQRHQSGPPEVWPNSHSPHPPSRSSQWSPQQ